MAWEFRRECLHPGGRPAVINSFRRHPFFFLRLDHVSHLAAARM